MKILRMLSNFLESRKKSQLDEIVEESLKKAALWDEVKDRLHESALSFQEGSNSGFVSREQLR